MLDATPGNSQPYGVSMNWRLILSVILVIAALAALAAGVMYFAVAPHSLPHFFPGYAKKASVTGTHWKRGAAGVGAAIVLAGAAAVVFMSGRQSRRRRHRRY